MVQGIEGPEPERVQGPLLQKEEGKWRELRVEN
jgi:hypothetical protein